MNIVEYKLTGTTTGRSTTRKSPKELRRDKRLHRKLMRRLQRDNKPGHVFVTADFSEIEVRILQLLEEKHHGLDRSVKFKNRGLEEFLKKGGHERTR